jgi:hypothetical protein
MREPELLARTFEADGEVSLAEFLRRMDEREARGAPASAAG